MAEVTPFQVEAWSEYGVGVLVLLLRFFARWKAVGFAGWQGDDYFSVLSLIFWTLELVTLELVGRNGTNIGITDEMGAAMPKEMIDKITFGAKCAMAGWNFYVALIWCLKATMLFFYSRVTLGLKEQKLVKWTSAVTAIAFVAVLAVIWGHCTPVHKNWQVYPNPGDRCTLDVANYIALVVLNVSTDLMIVAIPIPILWTVRLSIKRKLLIFSLLCSGVFVMVAALLRCILSLQSIEGINIAAIWSVRETLVGIIAVNAVAIKPLFSNSRWLKTRTGGSSGRTPHSGYLRYGKGSGYEKGSGQRDVALSDLFSKRKMPKSSVTEMDSASEGHIASTLNAAEQGGYNNSDEARSTDTTEGAEGASYDGRILVTRTYEVSPANSETRPRTGV